MCDKASTGIEHVPPKGIFPEKKDLPPEIDLRKELMTVPACDEHNSAKSKDDEYLMNILVLSISANKTGENQFSTKILRSIDRNPRLMQRIFRDHQRVIVTDDESNDAFETAAVDIDSERINSILDHIARALFYYHYKEKYLGSVTAITEFMLFTLDPSRAEAENAPLASLSRSASEMFAHANFYGENPEVFKYQIADIGLGTKNPMRLYFYGGCKVLILFEDMQSSQV